MLWNNGDFERTDSASGFLILIYNHWANTADSSLSPSPSPVISLIKSWASHILPFTLPNQEHLFFNDFFSSSPKSEPNPWIRALCNKCFLVLCFQFLPAEQLSSSDARIKFSKMSSQYLKALCHLLISIRAHPNSLGCFKSYHHLASTCCPSLFLLILFHQYVVSF